MDDFWELSSIYQDFNDVHFISDSALLTKTAKGINDLCFFPNELSKKELVHRYIKLNELFEELFSKLHSYASFRFSANTRDDEALSAEIKIKSIRNNLEGAKTRFSELIDCDEVRNLLKAGEFGEYQFYISDILAMRAHKLSPEEEKLAAVLSTTGSDAWSKLHTKCVSGALSFENAGKIKYQNEKEERLSRFKALRDNMKSIEDISAASLNGIKGEAIALSEARGFESPLDETLCLYHFDRKILENLFGAIEDSLPVLRKYYNLKAKILDYNNGLPFFERDTTISDINMSMTYENAKSVILNAFQNFSPEMYLYGLDFLNSRRINYKKRAYKSSGDSCDGIAALKKSWIITNFGNTVMSANTLAHELGHGFHNINLFKQGILNYRYDLPVAETASKFSEILFKKQLRNEMGKESSLFCCDFELAGYINTIIDITSRFYFEKELFDMRACGELTASDINSIMRKAQQKAYGNSLDSDYSADFMWINKPHYYNAKRNFYNFPYVFGALISIKLFEFKENDPKNFPQKYNVLLESTGKYNVHDLFKLVGFELYDEDFFVSPLNYVKGLYKELESLISLN